VFKYRELRRMFGLKRIQIIGGWRKLHNERFYNMYASPSVIKMITSRRWDVAGHVAGMGRILM
jgi:hypothetical protein